MASPEGPSILDDLQIFFGDASPAVTRVYARLPGAQPGLRLTGTLRGPRCVYAHTLEVTAKFRPLPGHDPLVAEAVLPDACYWSPELPYLYSARVELWQGDQQLADVNRLFGIRPLATHGANLVYASKRFVLRAVAWDAPTDEALAICREVGAALYYHEPSDVICGRASDIGVLVVAEVSGSAQHLIQEVRRLARWPAVGFAVCQQQEGWPEEARAVAPNLLLSPLTTTTPLGMEKSEQVRFVPFDSLRGEGVQAFMDSGGPIVVLGETTRGLDTSVYGQIVALRRACDGLQHTMAKVGQFAGYVAI